MDVLAYATVTEVCARLAGRLSDDVLGSVREDYFGGEAWQAEATLVLSLAYEGVGITRGEHDLIRSTLDDANLPDLAAVAVIDAPPEPPYRFAPTGPARAPNPAAADAVLIKATPRQGGHQLRRAWREPLPGAPNGAAWVYVVQVPRGCDPLRVHAGLASTLWVEAREKWPIEVVVEGGLLPQYQAAVLAAAQPIRLHS